MNLIYQFWIHTEVVDSIGPLEYILNTPSHHRVHHGRNPYCIDKNYAGVLIIWDRIFGTFEAEKKDEELAYGLVHPLTTYDPIYIQIFNYRYILKRFWQIKGFKNKLSVLFKGPGWQPGTGRLGNSEDLPKVNIVLKFKFKFKN
jgi:alkylglycerol monooxygenase